MSTHAQVQVTQSEQVFMNIFNDENVQKYNEIGKARSKAQIQMAIDLLLNELEMQHPSYIFVDSPNLERDKNIKIGVIINAFDRTRTHAKNRKTLWNKGCTAEFNPDFVFDFERKIIID